MIKNIVPKLQYTDFFCHKYWKNINKKQTDVIPRTRFDFVDANEVILGLVHNDEYKNISCTIKHNDLTQKLASKELNDSLTIWRGIPEKAGDIPSYIKNLYLKCQDLKKGDVLYMPEYSFWARERNYALRRAITESSSNSCILYELTLPKGYNLYENYHPILPRAVKFLCLGNKKLKSIKKGYEYNLIKLELLK